MDGRRGFFFDDGDDFPFRGDPFRRKPRHPGFNEWDGHEDPINSIFRDTFGGHMIREMEDMMRNFGSMFSMFDRQFANDPFFSPIEGPFRHPGMKRPNQDAEDEDWKGPIIEELPPDAPLSIEGPREQTPRRSPRDEVLKERRNAPMRDEDLDEQYRRYGLNGLFNLFPPDEEVITQKDVIPDRRDPFRGFRSFSKSSAFSTVRLPNGAIEERRTYVDSQGNEHRIFRRTVGDKTFERVIKKDGKTGQEEETRNLVNLDEDQVGKFLEGVRLDDKPRVAPRNIPITYNDQQNQPEDSSHNRSGGWLGKLKNLFGGRT